MRRRLIPYLLLAVTLAAFVWQTYHFDFYQDDAYITYRYAANYLQGDGLVFNAGERVEGYTNFGWLLGLIAVGVAGLDYLVLSKIIGIFFGGVAIVFTFLISEHLIERRSPWWTLLPAALVGLNPSLAYWAQSGLETGAFVGLTTLTVYLFIVRSRLLAAAIVALVLVRPEGALVAAFLIVAEFLVYRRRPYFSLTAVGLALLFSLPYAVSKLIYYGSLLPNPFYAKTAFEWEQVTSGWEYAIVFARHYPHLAAGLILLPFLWTRLGNAVRAVWIVAAAYSLYVIAIGGDVLMVHRFFLAVLPLMAVALTLFLVSAARRFRPGMQNTLLAVAAPTLVVIGLVLPREYVQTYAGREAGLVHKMGFFAARMNEIGAPNFSVAATTIGRLGYDLLGHRVIDMLGLTDTTIARHPEPVPAGLESTWRERSFNSRYLLEQEPDFIVFSTGLKPSAPAEKVLLTYDQFLDCYRAATWYYQPTETALSFPLISIFRKMRPLEPPFEPRRPIEFVNAYTNGVNYQIAGRLTDSERELKRARQLGGDPPYVYLLYRLAIVEFQQNKVDEGMSLQRQVLELDSSVAELHADLYVFETAVGDPARAALHRRWLERLSPWLVPRYDSVAQARARQVRDSRTRPR